MCVCYYVKGRYLNIYGKKEGKKVKGFFFVNKHKRAALEHNDYASHQHLNVILLSETE